MKIIENLSVSLKISRSKFLAEITSSAITIYQIAENLQSQVAEVSLKASFFKFYVKQPRFKINELSILTEEVGPEFYYNDFAFTAFADGQIYFYYFTEDNELQNMQEKVENQAVDLVAVDCVLGEDLAIYLILTSQNIHILNCQPDFLSKG